jgi:predicted nucleic acid-binding protein
MDRKMTRYMIDTDVLIGILRGQDTAALDWLRNVEADAVSLSAITVGELYLGVALKHAAKQAGHIDALVQRFGCAPVIEPIARRYAQLAAHLLRSGQPIGVNDTWIGAHSLCLGTVLVTRNNKHFDLVPDLLTFSP